MKIWDAKGRILYSDDANLIDSTYPLDGAQVDALRTGLVVASNTDLSLRQNRSEEDMGPLLSVCVPISTW